MKCEYVKKDGKQCGGYAIRDSKFCYFHSPEMASNRKKASSEGGSSSTLGLEPAEPIKLENQKTVVDLLLDTVNRVRRVRKDGSMDVKTANCIGFLAGKIVEANKASEKEQPEENKNEEGGYSPLWFDNPIEAARQTKSMAQNLIKFFRRDLEWEFKNDPQKRAEIDEKIIRMEGLVQMSDDVITVIQHRNELEKCQAEREALFSQS